MRCIGLFRCFFATFAAAGRILVGLFAKSVFAGDACSCPKPGTRCCSAHNLYPLYPGPEQRALSKSGEAYPTSALRVILVPSQTPSLRGEPTCPTINSSAVNHIVVLMLENRSFDHMLGFLYADAHNVSPTGKPFECPRPVKLTP